MNTPKHLGGHANTTHIDRGALLMFREIGAQSMADLGCGPGGQVAQAKECGFDAFGIDGDPACMPDVLHDFATGTISTFGPVDLVWCVEFLEHVDERSAQNFAPVFRSARWAVITHALPGVAGHHHVNCQTSEYWQGYMAALGLIFDPDMTARLRECSTMEREFVRNTGAVYAAQVEP